METLTRIVQFPGHFVVVIRDKRRFELLWVMFHTGLWHASRFEPPAQQSEHATYKYNESNCIRMQ